MSTRDMVERRSTPEDKGHRGLRVPLLHLGVLHGLSSPLISLDVQTLLQQTLVTLFRGIKCEKLQRLYYIISRL